MLLPQKKQIAIDAFHARGKLNALRQAGLFSPRFDRVSESLLIGDDRVDLDFNEHLRIDESGGADHVAALLVSSHDWGGRGSSDDAALDLFR